MCWNDVPLPRNIIPTSSKTDLTNRSRQLRQKSTKKNHAKTRCRLKKKPPLPRGHRRRPRRSPRSAARSAWPAGLPCDAFHTRVAAAIAWTHLQGKVSLPQCRTSSRVAGFAPALRKKRKHIGQLSRLISSNRAIAMTKISKYLAYI